MGESECVEPGSGGRLPVWALASFHAALLVALAVGVLYATGAAGDVLAGLETWIGALAYLYLWGVAVWTNRALFERIDGDLVAERPGPTALLAEASKWGGLAGLLVFIPILVVGIVFFVGAGGLEAVPFVLLAAVIGTVVSVGIGVVVGVVFALLDLLLLGAARSWLSADGGETVPPDP